MKMFFATKWPKRALMVALTMGLLSSCIHKKYETPITKDTQQPDKVLFDKAMHDIERGRYEVARITLNTLMNTYESSEYLAKAKLAIADSWYREGGGNGLAQAEAEYKDFELFYPTMQESAEAQHRICMIHYKQMEKSDRDPSQALRAQNECRALIQNYPNSKYAPETAQLLRNIQEALGEHEFGIGTFYFERGANPAAVSRLSYLTDQYPLYSKTDEALYSTGRAYLSMGPRFRQKAGEAFARIVREYPLSARADDAKEELKSLEFPIPEADRAAYDRDKYNQENYHRRSLISTSTDFLHRGPDTSHASKMGNPSMAQVPVPLPLSVPVANNLPSEEANAGGGAPGSDVSGTVVQDSTKLDQSKDARGHSESETPKPVTTVPQQPLPTNRDAELSKLRAKQQKKAAKLKKKKKNQEETKPVDVPAAPATEQPAPAQQGTSTPTGGASAAPQPNQ